MPTTVLSRSLSNAYRNILRAKFDLEYLMDKQDDPPGEVSLIDGATASFEDGVLKIVVPDYLPKSRFITSAVRNSWLGIIAKPLLSMDVHFDRALCVIVPYLPREGWDVDNRGYGIIINALRYARVIGNDTYHELAFMVIGDVDKENPRTEIYVRELPLSTKELVSTTLGALLL